MIRKATLAASLFLAACATAPAQPISADLSADSYGDFLIGRVAGLSNDFASAAERYQAALARAPNDGDLLDSAAVSALAAGDVDRARAIAHGAPRGAGSTYVSLIRAADDINTQRWHDATTELAGAHGGIAQELIARMLGVWAKAGQGRVDAIDDDLQPLLSVRPYGGLLQYQQAMALDLAGRNTDALAAYTQAANAGMWLPPAVIRNADLLVRTGARDQAITLLTSDVNAGNPATIAAAIRLQGGQTAATEPLTASRGAAYSLYGLAAIYLQQSDLSDGMALLTLSQMLDPTLAPARIAFAQQQSQLGHADIAQHILHDVPATSDYASTARVLEAYALVDQEHSDEGMALMRDAAASGDNRAKRALADMHRDAKQYDQAEPLYSELIAASPDDWRLYFARGAARLHLNRVEEGEADMQHALVLSPDQPDVLNYLGYSWIDRGAHMDEALAMLQRAATLKPDSGAIIDSLGWGYFRMGRYDDARDNLEHAVELDPSDATLNDHLGDVYWRVGRRIEARYQWQRALTETPDDAAAIQAKLDHGLPAERRTQSARR